MAKVAVKDGNAVHTMANWCQRIVAEKNTQHEFEENWGFLKSEEALRKEKELKQALDCPIQAGPVKSNVLEKIKNNFDDKEAVRDLDVTKTLRSTLIQTMGGSMRSDGFSPQEKYSFPQTENQKLGWHSGSSLDFGAREHARKSAKWMH